MDYILIFSEYKDISISLSLLTIFSDVDSDEFFDADNELEGGAWPTGQVLEPRSMSIPVAEKDPDDIEEDADLKEDNDTSGKREGRGEKERGERERERERKREGRER